MRTSMSIWSACFPRRGKHADRVPIFTGSTLFIWESALHFMLQTFGLLSGKKNYPTYFSHQEQATKLTNLNQVLFSANYGWYECERA
jgi:hypothetical protein